MKKIFLIPFFCFAVSLQAQTVLENNPPRIKWNQINTRDFRILFPAGFEDQGQRMANTLQHIHDAEAKSLGSKPRKVSIILQTQSSVANGFVSMLPRRSEFQIMPTQNYNFGGTNDWLNQLATHEYRHVVQYQHAMRGFTKAVYYLFGSTTFTGLTQAAAPRWFFEGDAVATETAFTPSGRGRIPNFGLTFRSNLMEGREFNYHKQYLRSYKNFIPDHYVLGYHMISYLRQRTKDPEIWGKITARAWNVPFIPFRFSSAIKKETGLYVTKLYREMARDLRQQWQADLSELQPTSFEKVNIRKGKAYTDYLYPQVLADGSIVALKKGIGDIEQFVRVDGGDQKIYTPGVFNETGMISSANSTVLWNEFGFDPRWGVRNFTLIKAYDPATGKLKVIGGKKERFAGSALSPDGRQVVTVRTDDNYKTSLLILDFNSGNVVKKFSNPENDFFSMPRWSADGKNIVVLKTISNKRSAVLVNVESGSMTTIVPESEENIGYPVLTEKYLLFNSPISGIDNIYAVDLQSGQRYQVTSSKYGAYNPALSNDGKILYYNDQSRDGLDVVKTGFDPAQWKIFIPQLNDNSLVSNLVEQEGRPGLFDSIPSEQHTVRRYSRLKGIINPYSWGVFTDNTFAQAEFGIASRDILSTTNISLGLAYDINERTLSRKAAISYQGWFPILDFQYLAGDRKSDDTAFGNSIESKWEESTIEGGVRIPLVLTNSKYLRSFTIGNYVGMTKVTSFENVITHEGTPIRRYNDRYFLAYDTLVFLDRDQLSNGNFVYNRFSVSFNNLLKRSYRDFLYRWGQTIDFELYGTPYGGDFKGQLASVRGTVYFPGVFKHHFLYFRGGYQKSYQGDGRERNVYLFRNRLFKPRGHSFPADETFASFSGNYAFPLWYPDISIGPLLNIQRIKLNMFYDFGQGKGQSYYYSIPEHYVERGPQRYYSKTDATYQSFGVETTVDFNVMRFLPQFEVGFRTTYRVANPYTNGGVLVEFLIGNIGF